MCMVINNFCYKVSTKPDAGTFVHQFFGRFRSGCSGSFLELPERSVHIRAGVFGIGGGHLSQ